MAQKCVAAVQCVGIGTDVRYRYDIQHHNALAPHSNKLQVHLRILVQKESNIIVYHKTSPRIETIKEHISTPLAKFPIFFFFSAAFPRNQMPQLVI